MKEEIQERFELAVLISVFVVSLIAVNPPL